MELLDSKIYLVIAGNYSQFIFWCDEHHVSTRRRNIIYVSSADNIKGFMPPKTEIIKCGTWYKRTDVDKIKKELSYHFSYESI